MIVPVFFVIGVALHWLMTRFAVNALNSLLVTFGFTVIIEVAIQSIWTADFRRSRRTTRRMSIKVGRALRAGARADHSAAGGRARLRHLGCGCATPISARRCAPPPRTPIAAAFGVNHKKLRLSAGGHLRGLAGVAGVCLALIATLAPAQIYAWVGVVFAAVMLGGLGSALGRWSPACSSASARRSPWR